MGCLRLLPCRWKFVFFIVLLFRLWPQAAGAVTPPVLEIGVGAVPPIVTSDHYQIGGVVYPYMGAGEPGKFNQSLPPGVPVFLLVHGLMESSRVWRDLGSELAQHGQVVMINVRGHGRGAHRSLPRRGIPRGVEGTDAMSVEGGDIDAAVRSVHQWTSRQVVLAGHSNGGMISRQWLRGAGSRAPV